MAFDWSALKEKKGSLPVWGWALIAAVIMYLAYRWFRSRSISGSNTATTTASGTGNSNLGYPAGAGAGSVSLPTMPSPYLPDYPGTSTPGGDLVIYNPPPDSSAASSPVVTSTPTATIPASDGSTAPASGNGGASSPVASSFKQQLINSIPTNVPADVQREAAGYLSTYAEQHPATPTAKVAKTLPAPARTGSLAAM